MFNMEEAVMVSFSAAPKDMETYTMRGLNYRLLAGWTTGSNVASWKKQNRVCASISQDFILYQLAQQQNVSIFNTFSASKASWSLITSGHSTLCSRDSLLIFNVSSTDVPQQVLWVELTKCLLVVCVSLPARQVDQGVEHVGWGQLTENWKTQDIFDWRETHVYFQSSLCFLGES